MTDFREIFLAESVRNLIVLRDKLSFETGGQTRREDLRTIHTVKGGLQTFGLKNAARLAGEIENILAQTERLENRQNLLEGVSLLIASLESGDTENSDGFFAKLQSQKTAETEVLLTKIPRAAFKKFSESEQNQAIAAIRQRKTIFCIEIGFEASNFVDAYRSLRKTLSETGEIIAALPSAKQQSEGLIGFQIFFSGYGEGENLREILKDFNVEISSHGCVESEPDEIHKILSQIAAHGEEIAAKSNKIVVFSILANDSQIDERISKSLFEILLHLVRNAIDHAIETSGKIEIRLFEEDNDWHLTFADDGRGVNLEKLRARAIEKNLISADDLPDEKETLALVFASELSTAGEISEISGRGVGLDAVRSAVEQLNGKISVKHRKPNGTIFEIFLPK